MNKIVVLFSLLVLLCLTACEPKVFGVPQSTWDTLTPRQKQQVIDSYNQERMVNAVQKVVNSAGVILNQSQK